MGRGAGGGGRSSKDDTISVSQVSSTGRSVIPSLVNGVKTKSVEAGITGHGFRYMGAAEFQKFKTGKLKYGGEAANEHEKGIMFANAPGDFYYGGGSRGIYLIEVNVRGTGGGLSCPSEQCWSKECCWCMVLQSKVQDIPERNKVGAMARNKQRRQDAKYFLEESTWFR